MFTRKVNDVLNNDIIDKILRFRDERDWAKFHNPKDLAISVSIEAGELLECFQWKDDNHSLSEECLEEISDEIADVYIYLLLLCDKLNIDTEQIILSKIEKNREKYPIDKSRGNSKKYNQL